MHGEICGLINTAHHTLYVLLLKYLFFIDYICTTPITGSKFPSENTSDTHGYEVPCGDLFVSESVK
jgi:hypothetical protein